MAGTTEPLLLRTRRPALRRRAVPRADHVRRRPARQGPAGGNRQHPDGDLPVRRWHAGQRPGRRDRPAALRDPRDRRDQRASRRRRRRQRDRSRPWHRAGQGWCATGCRR